MKSHEVEHLRHEIDSLRRTLASTQEDVRSANRIARGLRIGLQRERAMVGVMRPILEQIAYLHKIHQQGEGIAIQAGYMLPVDDEMDLPVPISLLKQAHDAVNRMNAGEQALTTGEPS